MQTKLYAKLSAYVGFAVSLAVLLHRQSNLARKAEGLSAQLLEIENGIKRIPAHTDEFRDIQSKLNQILSEGAPDYDKAKQAANAMNSFHDGLCNILSYNSMQARKKKQEQAGD